MRRDLFLRLHVRGERLDVRAHAAEQSLVVERANRCCLHEVAGDRQERCGPKHGRRQDVGHARDSCAHDAVRVHRVHAIGRLKHRIELVFQHGLRVVHRFGPVLRGFGAHDGLDVVRRHLGVRAELFNHCDLVRHLLDVAKQRIHDVSVAVLGVHLQPVLAVEVQEPVIVKHVADRPPASAKRRDVNLVRAVRRERQPHLVQQVRAFLGLDDRTVRPARALPIQPVQHVLFPDSAVLAAVLDHAYRALRLRQIVRKAVHGAARCVHHVNRRIADLEPRVRYLLGERVARSFAFNFANDVGQVRFAFLPPHEPFANFTKRCVKQRIQCPPYVLFACLVVKSGKSRIVFERGHCGTGDSRTATAALAVHQEL